MLAGGGEIDLPLGDILDAHGPVEAAARARAPPAAPGRDGKALGRQPPPSPAAGKRSRHARELATACRKVSKHVPGYRATCLLDEANATLWVWIELDMTALFKLGEPQLQRRGILCDGPRVVMLVRFEDTAERGSARFERLCEGMPTLEEEKWQALACAQSQAQPERKHPNRGAVRWLLADRVRNKFCVAPPAERCLAELLANLGEFLGLYLAHAPSHCLICDRKLDIAMPKLAVCDSEICTFQSREMGLGFSIEEEILNRPQVVELLLTFFCCSLLSRREIDLSSIPRKIIENSSYPSDFQPFVDIISSDLSPNELSLFYALGFVPSIDVMVDMVRAGSLRLHLDGIDARLYPLLQWLIGGCRSYIRVLEPHKRFKDMNTPHQFVFDAAAVEKEARFQKLYKESGSFFAFHGSSSFAWNSIIANGLKNLSNTNDMSYGAIKGSGIYFSTSFHTSLHYAKPTKLKQPWANSGLGRNPRAIALCEIIDRPSEFAFTDTKCFTECTPQERANGQLHVVPQEDYVHTRYLFVYSETVVPPEPTHHIFSLRSSVVVRLQTLRAPTPPTYQRADTRRASAPAVPANSSRRSSGLSTGSVGSRRWSASAASTMPPSPKQEDGIFAAAESDNRQLKQEQQQDGREQQAGGATEDSTEGSTDDDNKGDEQEEQKEEEGTEGQGRETEKAGQPQVRPRPPPLCTAPVPAPVQAHSPRSPGSPNSPLPLPPTPYSAQSTGPGSPNLPAPPPPPPPSSPASPQDADAATKLGPRRFQSAPAGRMLPAGDIILTGSSKPCPKLKTATFKFGMQPTHPRYRRNSLVDSEDGTHAVGSDEPVIVAGSLKSYLPGAEPPLRPRSDSGSKRNRRPSGFSAAANATLVWEPAIMPQMQPYIMPTEKSPAKRVRKFSSHEGVACGLRRECLATQAARNQGELISKRVRELEDHVRELRMAAAAKRADAKAQGEDTGLADAGAQEEEKASE